MRPSVNVDSPISRPRKQSDLSERSSGAPTTFFLTREPESSSAPRAAPCAIDTDKSPVRSLKDTLEEVDKHSKQSLARHRQQAVRSNSRRRSTIKQNTIDEIRGDLLNPPTTSAQSPSSPPTPSITSNLDSSVPSSPKSISSASLPRSEDEIIQDDASSQAVASEDEDEDGEELNAEVRDSAPQLIMPSIKMPSRRPFTDQGKRMGKFKIVVGGRAGMGRTSLIKSIVQLCEDIVHVDSLPTTSKSPTIVAGLKDTTNLHEIYASTKPYPSWWSDIDESRILKRRKSVGDSVLERNICFVDTSGPGDPDAIVQYLEQQLIKSVNSISLANNDFVGLLSGRGGSQADVVLYLVSKDTLKDDINDIRRMSQLCNVIPLISKADLLSSDVISELKAVDFAGTSIPRLPFISILDGEPATHSPYYVSSANGPDFDNMDASLLMSPEYVRPLVASELALLVKGLFSPDTVSYLRHTTAKKLAAWYASEPRLTKVSPPSLRSPQASTLNSPLPTSLSNSGILVPVTSELSLNTSNSYALAKVADHTRREEHLAQIRLSKWASDLQLSLQRERERYEHLAQGERALWLMQRMGEEIREGQVITLSAAQAGAKANEKSQMVYSELRYEGHDPLGLLRWQDAMRTRGWATLQIVGGFGVFGGVALWLAKTWGLTMSWQEWVQSWSGNFNDVSE